MAKYETILENKSFSSVLEKLNEEILACSFSAILEDSSDFEDGDARTSVRVFERYSLLGKNRLSLTVTLFQSGEGTIHVSLITSGGSQAVFFKVNTLGEKTFLEEARNIVDRLKRYA